MSCRLWKKSYHKIATNYVDSNRNSKQGQVSTIEEIEDNKFTADFKILFDDLPVTTEAFIMW